MCKPLYSSIPRYFFSLLVLGVLVACDQGETDIEDRAQAVSEDWSWENPYSFRTITIPKAWQNTKSQDMDEAMLSLTHSSGRSIVYIMNEESIANLDLDEYMDAVKPALLREIGIEAFTLEEDLTHGAYMQGIGAQYLGDTLAGTYAHIWTTGELTFWRVVAMTSLEYKSLEYEARELVELLRVSSY